MTILSFSSVPGMMWPGAAEPGLISGSPVTPPTSYIFYGHVPLAYPDYVDTSTLKMLTVIPGGTYSMAVVKGVKVSVIPPPDGRWTPGGTYSVPLHAPKAKTLAEVRADIERSKVARGYYDKYGNRAQ